MFFLVRLVFLSFVTISVFSKDNVVSTEKDDLFMKRIDQWKQFAKVSHDNSRNESVRGILSKISGIYKDKNKVKNTRLEKTVLINVIETTDNENNNDKYKHYLKNLLCYAKHYDYETVVYIIEPNVTRYEMESNELTSFNKDIHILPYPYELFWQLISAKNNTMNVGFGKADYLGSYPTFKHFGAFTMLVPIYEALLLGYNVIFFDVDVALVADPLPHMIHGNADFVVSPEMRTCVFPSLIPTTDWHALEPNTGTMHVRSTPSGEAFFAHWLGRLVAENCMNDQRVANFGKEVNAVRVNSCDGNNRPNQMTRFGSTPTGRDVDMNINMINGTTPAADVFRFCYLNEFIFQNGLMEFYCRVGKRGSSISAYMLGMKHKGLGIQSGGGGGGSVDAGTNNNNSVGAAVGGGNELSSYSTVKGVITTSKHLFGRSILSGVNNSNNNNESSEEMNPIVNNKALFEYRQVLSNAERHAQQVMYTPATLHVNFCVTKRKGLEDRGLWLYHHTLVEKKLVEKCIPYNVQKTHYALQNWTEKITTAEEELSTALKSMKRSEVVMFPRQTSVYLYENDSLHLIPNRDTFISLGFNFEDVKILKGPLYWLLPFGSEIPSVNVTKLNKL